MRNLNPLAALAALLILTAWTTPAQAEPCEPGWAAGEICYPGIWGKSNADSPNYGSVNAIAVWDDGTGEKVYAGGSFTVAGCEAVANIALWDGVSWSALGSGLNGEVHALCVFDDGNGPALYAGGEFTTAGGVTAGNIARWNGSSWSALVVSPVPWQNRSVADLGGNGVNGTVRTLTVFDDGAGPALYAGGDFTTARGGTVNRIVKWDGSSWTALSGPSSTGVGNTVHALTVFDDGTGPALYAGGAFSTAGGVPANQVAKWDGSVWSALPDSPGLGWGRTVYALAGFDDGSGPALYVGGDFPSAGGVTVNRIMKWDGSAWSALSGSSGTGVNSTVWALTVFDDGTEAALYAGGEFSTAGGVSANRVAKWDGSNWSALEGPNGNGVGGFPPHVYALTVLDDGTGATLCAGGVFYFAGGVRVHHIAAWDGSEWEGIIDQDGLHLGSVNAIVGVDDGSGPVLYTGSGQVMAKHGSGWSLVAEPGGNGLQECGGCFTSQSLEVYTLAIFDDGNGDSLYAGGNFLTADGKDVNFIARWNGTSWSPLGEGTSFWVRALAVFDDGSGPALYAGGQFLSAGGQTVNLIARWDGSEWSPLTVPGGIGVSGIVHAMTVFDDGTGPALYVAGTFATAGGIEANRIARWNGSAWSALEGPGGVGVDSTVRALAMIDDGSGGGPALYAGGAFTTAGGVTVNRIARWDGSAWSALEGPGGVGMNNTVYALSAFDDGTGPALYAGGTFTTAGGVTVNRIAKWDGSTWSALTSTHGVGMSNSVLALTVFDDGSGGGPALYAGGGFITAGGFPSPFFAKWTGCPPVCGPADLNGDGLLDLADIVAFVTAFSAGGPAADLAEPFGVFDLADLVAFVVAFEAGCP